MHNDGCHVFATAQIGGKALYVPFDALLLALGLSEQEQRCLQA